MIFIMTEIGYKKVRQPDGTLTTYRPGTLPVVTQTSPTKIDPTIYQNKPPQIYNNGISVSNVPLKPGEKWVGLENSPTGFSKPTMGIEGISQQIPKSTSNLPNPTYNPFGTTDISNNVKGGEWYISPTGTPRLFTKSERDLGYVTPDIKPVTSYGSGGNSYRLNGVTVSKDVWDTVNYPKTQLTTINPNTRFNVIRDGNNKIKQLIVDGQPVSMNTYFSSGGTVTGPRTWSLLPVKRRQRTTKQSKSYIVSKKSMVKRTKPSGVKNLIVAKKPTRSFGVSLLGRPKSIGKKVLAKPMTLKPIKRKQKTNKTVTHKKPATKKIAVKRKCVIKKR